MRNMSPVRGQPIGLVPVLVRLRGTGAAAPAVEIGPHGEPAVASATSGLSGVTVVRNSIGNLSLTFSEPPGRLVAVTPGHGADAPTATTPRALEWDSNSMTGTGRVVDLRTITPATDLAAAALSDLGTGEVQAIIFWFLTVGDNPT